jgi:hypothetical protein
MSRKIPEIAKRLLERQQAASSAPPLNILTAALTLLEDFRILNQDWKNTSADDVVAQQHLWWAALAVIQCFLSSLGQASPAISAFIDALQNTTNGVTFEKRLAHPVRLSKAHTVVDDYARAQVIAAINKASPDRRQQLLRVGAVHLNQTPKQVSNLVKNYNNTIKSGALRVTAEAIERQIDAGYGPDLDALRKAHLLG